MFLNQVSTQFQTFGKKYLTGVKVMERTPEGKFVPAEADLFEINPKDRADRGYFDRLGESWLSRGKFCRAVAMYFNYYDRRNPKTFYALESADGKPLCIAQTGKSDGFCTRLDGLKAKDVETLDYIETHPDFQHNSRKREYKNTGNAMLAGIVEQIEDKGKQGLWLVPEAKDFFADSGYFEPSEMPGNIILKQEHFDDFIKHVEKKTEQSE